MPVEGKANVKETSSHHRTIKFQELEDRLPQNSGPLGFIISGRGSSFVRKIEMFFLL